MKIGGTSEQFRTPYLSVNKDDAVEKVLKSAREIGATYYDGEDLCFVVEFTSRQGVIELYTEQALRDSLPRSALRLMK
jgi:hypothetical protein